MALLPLRNEPLSAPEITSLTKTPSKAAARSYKTVGKTFDGVDVLAPKTKSKTFTAAEVRSVLEKALNKVSAAKAAKPLRDTDALRVKKRPDGRFEIRKPGAARASGVFDTQTEAVARARELMPGQSPIAKRVRKKPGAKRGTWRET